jgi:NADH dehydrogenase
LSDKATAMVDAPPPSELKRVVIVGGGFAGLAAAHALRHADAEIVLVDRRNHHIFQPLLYQVAMGVLSPTDIAAPIRQLEVKQRNLSVLLAEVTGVDVAARTIEASSPGVGVREIAFDYLVIATGMRPSYFGHDEFARYAPGLKSLSDAETIRAKILTAFEFAATTGDERERARQMTFVLVGAGPTGVELAASLAQMVRVTLSGNFRRIDPSKSAIILLDAGNRVLPTFVEPLSPRVTRRHGSRQQKLRGAGAGLDSHQRLPDVAGLGIRPYPLPAADAEPPARAASVAVVIFHRPAQLAADPRTAANTGNGNEVKRFLRRVGRSTVSPG